MYNHYNIYVHLLLFTFKNNSPMEYVIHIACPIHNEFIYIGILNQKFVTNFREIKYIEFRGN